MADTDPLGSRTLADLLAAIASTEPSPGAGAAGGIALALAVACARKAVRISGLHHPDDASLVRADTHLARIGAEALAQGCHDARQFDALIRAMQLPQRDAEEETARSAAMHAARAALDATSRHLTGLCDQAREAIDAVSGHAEDNLSGDIEAARALIGAARAIHAANLAEGKRDGG